jgi:hypothetical protein
MAEPLIEFPIVKDHSHQGYNYEYLYGSESEGPHKDICELVQSGIKITDEWLKGQKDKNPKSKKKSLIRMLQKKFRTKSRLLPDIEADNSSGIYSF